MRFALRCLLALRADRYQLRNHPPAARGRADAVLAAIGRQRTGAPRGWRRVFRTAHARHQNTADERARQSVLALQAELAEVEKQLHELQGADDKETARRINDCAPRPHLDRAFVLPARADRPFADIELLHDYNERKDVGQMLLGKIATIEGLRTRDLYPRFGLELQD